MTHYNGWIAKKGFTLSEVLIALGVIGVIAALTLTNLVKNYQKQRMVSQVKSAYNLFANAIQMSVYENGNISNWDFSLNYTDFTKRYLLPYLNSPKPIDSYDVTTLHSDANNFAVVWRSNAQQKYILPNGVVFSDIVTHAYTGLNVIFVDINGPKKPNKLGRDVFVFTINEEGKDKLSTCNKYWGGDCVKEDLSNSHYQGMMCSGKLEKDGWKVKNDYPW